MARRKLRSLEPLVLQVSPFCRCMTSTACKEEVLCLAHEHKSMFPHVQELMQHGGTGAVNGPAGHALCRGMISEASTALDYLDPDEKVCVLHNSTPAVITAFTRHPSLSSMEQIAIGGEPGQSDTSCMWPCYTAWERMPNSMMLRACSL